MLISLVPLYANSLFKHCVKCENKAPEDQCVLYHDVERVQNADQFIGSVITCADPGDRVQPSLKVSSFQYKLLYTQFFGRC